MKNGDIMKAEKNILIAFILNLAFSIFEFIGGSISKSIAISSDAIHDLGDSLSIGLSFILERISKKKPNDIYTYGYLRYSIIGSLITTSILLCGSLLVSYSAIKRIINPVEINSDKMIFFALIGVFINLLATYFTKKGKSLNQKSVHLHMLEDVLGWVVVLMGAILMKFVDIKVIDPIMSIGVAIFIFINALKNFKEILDLFLEKTPKNINIKILKNNIRKIKGVMDVHHIHIWSIDGINNYATLHVVEDSSNKKIKEMIRKIFNEYDINHITIELEKQNENCELKNCEIKEIHHHH